MSYGAIQFYGIEAVVTAYQNKGTPAFAIWCGKQLQFRYDGTYGEGKGGPSIEEGAQLLQAYLEAIYQGSTAMYTLKTYDEIGPGEKIKPSTEYDTAFNFKLGIPGEMGGAAYMGGRSPSPLLLEIQKINARLDARDAEEEYEEEPQTLESAAIGLLNKPEELRDVLESVRGLVDLGRSLLGFPVQSQPSGQIGAVTRAGEATIGEEAADPRYQALERALNTLERHDPKLIEHLTRLSELAEANPIKFKSLLTILETM